MMIRSMLPLFILGMLTCQLMASDYEAELKSLDEAILKVDSAPGKTTVERLRYIFLRYRRASLTGDVSALQTLAGELAAALPTDDRELYELPTLELATLRVKILLKLHRLGEAQALLDKYQLPDAAGMDAELALQRDDLAGAETKLAKLAQARPTWDNLARWAHCRTLAGRVIEADALYARAQDQLTVKEMRDFAWLEWQRGRLDFVAGRFDDAEAHYRTADSCYSGYWPVHESLAELTAAKGQIAEAVALYEQLLKDKPRPETSYALGLLYRQAGQRELANQALERAHRAFLESAQRGESHYLHHLVDYYCEIDNDGARALQWAQADFELRPNAHTRQALAWSLYLCGDQEQALNTIEQAMQTGLQDAHVFQRASRIYTSLGMKAEAQKMRERSLALSPRLSCFHAH